MTAAAQGSRPIWVYVAGPYSGGDQVLNTRAAIEVALHLLDAGLVPICPHLYMLAHLVSPQPYETWMRWDFELLERCDALIRLPGASSDADREVARASELGLPVIKVKALDQVGGLARYVRCAVEGRRDDAEVTP